MCYYRTRFRNSSRFILVFFCCVSFSAQMRSFGQDLDTSNTDDEQRKMAMFQMASRFEIHAVEKNGRKVAKLVKEPLLYFVDVPRRQSGSLWAWMVDGRPVAVSEFFSTKLESNEWNYAMVSMSDGRVTGNHQGQAWLPADAGVTFRWITEAPEPSSKSRIHTAQMRKVARRFAANTVEKGKRTELRLLTQPLFRYQADDVRGAIFSFVHGNNNPDLILLIETKGKKWSFGANRCTAYALELELDGNVVWKVAEDWGRQPDNPFFVKWLAG